MDLYKAKKGNIVTYIQPYMVEIYANMGFEIYKEVDVRIKNVEAEVNMINNKNKTPIIRTEQINE